MYQPWVQIPFSFLLLETLLDMLGLWTRAWQYYQYWKLYFHFLSLLDVVWYVYTIYVKITRTLHVVGCDQSEDLNETRNKFPCWGIQNSIQWKCVAARQPRKMDFKQHKPDWSETETEISTASAFRVVKINKNWMKQWGLQLSLLFGHS